MEAATTVAAAAAVVQVAAAVTGVPSLAQWLAEAAGQDIRLPIHGWFRRGRQHRGRRRCRDRVRQRDRRPGRQALVISQVASFESINLEREAGDTARCTSSVSAIRLGGQVGGQVLIETRGLNLRDEVLELRQSQ